MVCCGCESFGLDECLSRGRDGSAKRVKLWEVSDSRDDQGLVC